MVKIYNLGRGVYHDYITETVRGKDTNEFVLRLKLSAMIYATDTVIKRDLYKIYKIGKFCILVRNAAPDCIALVYWDQHKYSKTSPEVREKLVKAYRELGLNDEGNKYIRIPKEEGDDGCEVKI